MDIVLFPTKVILEEKLAKWALGDRKRSHFHHFFNPLIWKSLFGHLSFFFPLLFQHWISSELAYFSDSVNYFLGRNPSSTRMEDTLIQYFVLLGTWSTGLLNLILDSAFVSSSWCFLYEELVFSEPSSFTFYPKKQYRNILASASADKHVKIWDVVAGKCDITMAHHSDKARAEN